jgi:DNA polymerase III subunit delta'
MAKRSPSKKPAAMKVVGGAPTPPAQAPPRVELALEEIIGQPRPVAALQDAMSSGRIHHAWVFSGPEGVGKRTTALAFARELLLPPASDPQHEVLDAQLRSGSHPDLHLITAKLAKVSRENDIRGRKQTTLPREVLLEFLVEPASKTRVVSVSSLASKVFIVDDAHKMGDAAQNLLLKTLEEPPAGTVIILVTASEDRLLPTIRSRSQRVVFGALERADMQQFVEQLPESYTPTQRKIAEAISSGSPGRLQQVVEGGLVGWAEQLETLLQSADSGHAVPELGPLMADLVDAEAKRQVDLDALASKEAANRDAAADMLQLVAERHRRFMVRLADDPQACEHHARAIDAVAQTEVLIRSNVPLAHAFGLLGAELCAPRPEH